MNIPSIFLTLEQERELDKVNAFYLQKEAEVRAHTPCRYSSEASLILKLHSSRSGLRRFSIRRRCCRLGKAFQGDLPSSRPLRRAFSSLQPTSISFSSSLRSMVLLSPRFSRNGTRHPSPRPRSCIFQEQSRSNLSSMQPSLASYQTRRLPAYKSLGPGQMASQSTFSLAMS